MIVLGTGLKECILSGLLSVDGLKVSRLASLPIDRFPGASALSPAWVLLPDGVPALPVRARCGCCCFRVVDRANGTGARLDPGLMPVDGRLF